MSGPAGSGKSTFLQGLLVVLATAGWTPVAVRVDRHPDLESLEQELENSFATAMDRWVRMPSDAQRAWRTLRRSGRVVVLADGIDAWRARAGMSAGDALAALHRAINDKPYRFVVALRSEESDLAPSYPTFPLPELRLDEAARECALATLPWETDTETRRLWHEVLVASNAARSPLFMSLSLDLLATSQKLREVAAYSGEEVRIALLEAWVEQKLRRFDARYALDPQQLKRRVLLIAMIAVALGAEGRLEAAGNEIQEILSRHCGQAGAQIRWRT